MIFKAVMDDEMKQEGLQGMRVVELGGPVTAPAAGKLFADLGAVVIKVEPPEGEPGRYRPPFPPTVGTSPGGTPRVGKSTGCTRDAAPPVGGSFLHLNTNKRSLVIDWKRPDASAVFGALLAEADLLLHDLSPAALADLGLDLPGLCAAHPALVVVSMTPYGLTGPYAGYQASDLTLAHGGGLAWLTPDRSPPPDHPPLRPFGAHAQMQAGLHGAVAGLAACRAARLTGVGEHVDLSAFEVGVNLLCRHFTSYTYSGLEESRLGRNLTAPSTFFSCQDGHIFIIAVEQDQWERMVGLMGNPAWADDPAFGSMAARGVHEAMVRIEKGLAAFCADWKVDDLFHALQARRIGSAPVTTPASLEADPHLKDRAFFQPLHHDGLGEVSMPGAPYRLQSGAWALRSPAPTLGEMNGPNGVVPASVFPPRLSAPPNPATVPPKGEPPRAESSRPEPPAGPPLEANSALTRPLEGVRVLDLTWVWSGPYAAQLLAFLGAEVIKVESSGRVDIARRLNLFPKGMAPGVNRNAYFNQIGQGKKSIAVNLRHPDGLATVKALAAQSDVILSNFATGVMERLGLGCEDLHALHPGLIVANLSAFGQSGPYAHYMGYGPAITPLAGLAALTGYEEDGEPQNLRIAYADPNAGVYLTFAILAELSAREGGRQDAENPRPRAIDISLWESLICTSFEGSMAHALGAPTPRPLGNHDLVHAPHNLYRCRGDDAWVAVAVTDDAQWQGLCRALGRSNWADDPGLATEVGRKAHEDGLDAAIAEWCAGLDKWDVTSKLQAEGVPAFPALSNRELAENEHLTDRGFLVRHDHPEVGRLLHSGVPWRMEHRPSGVPSRAPLLGEHTDAVLAEVLCMPPEKIAQLRTTEAIE